jgi:hypothetical protein
MFTIFIERAGSQNAEVKEVGELQNMHLDPPPLPPLFVQLTHYPSATFQHEIYISVKN